MTALLYSDGPWVILMLGSVALLIVGIVAWAIEQWREKDVFGRRGR